LIPNYLFHLLTRKHLSSQYFLWHPWHLSFQLIQKTRSHLFSQLIQKTRSRPLIPNCPSHLLTHLFPNHHSPPSIRKHQ
jgi:hypothetical protein